MKAFVTGSTGLLGSNLIQQLVAQGHSVKALARSREKAAKLLDSRVEIVVGDMEDVNGFAPELAGCEVLFHTAAYFREYYQPGDHWQKLVRINVDGTLKLLERAEQAGVKKVIYVSSSTVIGARPDGAPSDESMPPDHYSQQNLYAKSKVAAEEAIKTFLKTHRLPVVLILPSAIWGPSDAAPTASGQLILNFLAQKVPLTPPGGFSVVDARDVARTMIAAVEAGQSGERYLLTNEYYTITEVFNRLETITGVPAPRHGMSYPAALAFAWLAELRARLTGTQPIVTISGIRALNSRWRVKADKACRELGFTTRSFEDTLRDEVRWYQEQGYIKTQLQPAAVGV